MQKVTKYIPEKAIPKILEIIDKHSFTLKIVKKRHTKHGDFRRLKNGLFQVTVNENLNPHQFLLTLVHEIAHYKTYKKYGSVKPHGKEWKMTFKELMITFAHPDIYPNSILPHLAKYLINPKASTDSDVNLSMALKQEETHSDKIYIFELLIEDEFILKKRHFKILEKKRTRYLCLEIGTNKKYIINQNTQVKHIQN